MKVSILVSLRSRLTGDNFRMYYQATSYDLGGQLQTVGQTLQLSHLTRISLPRRTVGLLINGGLKQIEFQIC